MKIENLDSIYDLTAGKEGGRIEFKQTTCHNLDFVCGYSGYGQTGHSFVCGGAVLYASVYV